MEDAMFSVDVETDGPIPGDYSLLSLGACLIDSPDVEAFYVEMQPIFSLFEPEALRVNGLDRDRLLREGKPPRIAMEEFASWVNAIVAARGEVRPVYVALNAPFDWSFTHWYMMHYLGADPFGHSAWDIRAHFAGVLGSSTWSESSRKELCALLGIEHTNTHNALEDAQEQARIFSLLRQRAA